LVFGGGVWGLVVSAPVLFLLCLILAAFLAWEAVGFFPRLVVSEEGVTWRQYPSRGGIVAWGDIREVRVADSYTEAGGGTHRYNADLILKDFNTVHVARSRTTNPWTEDEMEGFATLVRERIQS
jgi:hypothetical protein